MNDLYTNLQNSTKAAVEFAEINTKAFTEIFNNQVGLFNEVISASLSQVKKLQTVSDLSTAVEQNKAFGVDVETKTRKTATANLKVIEDSSKKAYDFFAKSATDIASPASSK